MTSSNTEASNKEYILLNNFRSKCSLLMKFKQFMSYYKSKKSKIFTKAVVKTSSRFFCVSKELSTDSIGK